MKKTKYTQDQGSMTYIYKKMDAFDDLGPL